VKAITTHLSADFDAFAAAVCAVRLFPDHQVLFPGSQEVAVRRFMEDTRFSFPELKLRQARRETFDHIVVTDTRNPARLGEVWQLIERDRCPITLIDHHVTEEDLLGARDVISRPVGATCTIVAQLMRERELPPSSEEASLLLMGIYEDTGGLSYRETSPPTLDQCLAVRAGGSLDCAPLGDEGSCSEISSSCSIESSRAARRSLSATRRSSCRWSRSIATTRRRPTSSTAGWRPSRSRSGS
jgi:tRNA nucleotidyltransferase (CCA-adding enzyme)